MLVDPWLLFAYHCWSPAVFFSQAKVDFPMPRASSVKKLISSFALVLVTLIPFACTETSDSVIGVFGGTGISLAPRYVYLGGQQSAAINRIRLTAMHSVSGAAVASQVFDVSD